MTEEIGSVNLSARSVSLLVRMWFSFFPPRLRNRSATAVHAAIVLFALAGIPTGFLLGQDIPRDWSIASADSRLTVNVLPAGLLASALHVHHFQPAEWGGQISYDAGHGDRVRVNVQVAADSLRDHQPELSAKDISKVEGQVRGPEILDSAKFPRILFEARQLEAAQVPSGGSGEFQAMLVGTLTLHGRSRPMKFPIQGRVAADRLTATAAVTFRQSDYGIKPYKAALGTIAVRDEVTVEISLVAIPHKPE